MIYTTFEQIEYGFVLLDINKKHLDINRFQKYKIERFGLNRPLQWMATLILFTISSYQ